MKRAWILLLAIVLVLGLAGCKSAEEKVAEKITESLLSDSDAKVDIEDGGDSITIETDEGETTISGGGDELPDDFPRDFPIDDDYENTGSSSVTGPDATAFYVNLETDDDFDKVYEWYKGELEDEGWEITTDMLISDEEDSALVSATKDDMDVTMSINETSDGCEIGIMLNVPK